MMYTMGYRGWKPDVIRQFIVDHEALLIDIRYKPWSPHPQWRSHALKALVQPHYRWIQELGNKAYRERPRRIEIADMDAGLGRLGAIAHEVPTVLLCGCPTLEECHRLTVARTIEDRWQVPVTHLQAPH